ncbi:hypothetical protein [Bosea sp. (in: a-proteobacteria)]|uniref:hypothetical protein n=1 Tax=Bosea sp. (in: a-proteobacteria) TaxID=1871050 RepID=UPI002B4A795E|nr:hypothetical protein [Bosea sp. (in: a-proteobacteria)]WRH57230.1 MAG: hypothetical protein RSE11_19830 [Bosea sp. (in: a-proteobacteria)]
MSWDIAKGLRWPPIHQVRTTKRAHRRNEEIMIAAVAADGWGLMPPLNFHPMRKVGDF